MSAIGEYLWWIAPSFMKKAARSMSIVFKLLVIVGEELDEVKIAVLDMRKQLLVANAFDSWLDGHGRDRDITRITGELDEEYRLRLLAAWLIKQRGGTIPGMVDGCLLIGLEVQVSEIYEIDPSRWAEFELTVVSGTLGVLNQSIFFDVVLALKPAHTRPVFSVLLPLDTFDDGEYFDDGNYFDEFVTS